MSAHTLTKLNSILVEYIKDPKIAQKVLEAVEVFLAENEVKVEKMTDDKILNKIQETKLIIKDDLKNELVTRDIFEEKFTSLRLEMDERFKRMELLFKVVIAIMVFGFTIFNPGFLEIIRIIFG
jgi:hypothetical protein